MTPTRPRVLADETAVFGDAPAATHARVDLMRRNVVAGGGREQIFLRALAAGLSVSGDGAGSVAGERMLDIAALAAWRSGVLAIRDDALARLQGLAEADCADIAASALGISVDAVDEFIRRQGTDRFWWPDRTRSNGYVLSFGGFAGLGGAWVRPPAEWKSFGDGSFAVRVAEEWWRLDADVWGAHLRRGDGRADSQAPSASDDSARLLVSDQTHVVWIQVPVPV